MLTQRQCWIWVPMCVVSIGLLLASLTGWSGIPLVEVFGFVTGAACVLLCVEENPWNWPIGIANNIFFIVFFWQSQLYGDTGLQFLYLGLGGVGWYHWLRGGTGGSALRITRTPVREAWFLLMVAAAATAGLTVLLRRVGDAAPFLDALTTVLSVVAQCMLMGKRYENWFVWMAADVIYVFLYVSRGMHLTAVLYAAFIGMCVMGLRQWRVVRVTEAA